MIIFYNKTTGKIIGTIDGRIHPEAHLNMWIGDKKETDRLILDWKPVQKGEREVEKNVLLGYKKNKDGLFSPVIGKKKQKEKVIEYEPKTSQKQLVIDIDKGKKKIFDYKVSLKTNKLVKK
jgi:hypothetical protein